MGQSESRQGQDVEVVFLDEDRWLWEEDSEPSKGVVKPTEAEASAIQYREYSLGFFHRTLGKGSFAVVKLAKHRITGHQVAVKIIKRQSTGLAKQAEEALLEREVKHQNLLRHQNVVRLHTWVTTPKEFLLVMEYCPKGDMLRYINELEHQQLRTAEARSFFAHLLEGLAFCHSLGICHRDLKLENLMLCPTGGAATASAAAAAEPPSPPWEALTLKIADFGLSDLNPIGILSTTYCGSPLYAAPELVGIGRREGFDASKSDAWSCGVILYAFLTSALPFDADDMRALLRKITRAHYVPIPIDPSDSTRQAASLLVARLLAVDPTKRLSARAALASDWMRRLSREERGSQDAAVLGSSIAATSRSLDAFPLSWAEEPDATLESHSLRVLPSAATSLSPVTSLSPAAAGTTPPPPPAPSQLAALGASRSESSSPVASGRRTASQTSSFYRMSMLQLRTNPEGSPSFCGVSAADLQAIQAESALEATLVTTPAEASQRTREESSEQQYHEFMSLVDAAI